MKKTLLLAMTAVGILAACQKNVTPEDNSPVAVELSVKGVDASVSTTRAAVEDDWSNAGTVHVYGLEVIRDDAGAQVVLGEGRYDFTNLFINAESSDVITEDGAITLDRSYYYSPSTSVVYDFYGYHDGGIADDSFVETMENDVVSFEATITGQEDLMYAYTDKAADVVNATKKVETYQAYGAWAARRGVQPTLVFQHALTRLNFHVVKGISASTDVYEALNVTDIKVVETPNTGTFVVVSPNSEEVGYTAVTGEGASVADFAHPYFAQDVEFAATPERQPIEGSILVAPKQEKIKVKLGLSATFSQEQNQEPITEDYNFTLTPPEGATEFLAGYQYDVIVTVYGPEEVKVSVSLLPWGEGGDVNYDPDNEENAPQA